MKKLSVLSLSLVLALSMTPITAFAVENDDNQPSQDGVMQAQTDSQVIPGSGWKVEGTTLRIDGIGIVGKSNLSDMQKNNVENIIIGEGATAIADRAFYGFKSLKTVSVLGKTDIGDAAFSFCSALETVGISNVQTIHDYAFQSCEALKSVTMSSVQTIGDYAFRGCEQLSSVTLPKTLKEIGSSAFGDIAESANIEFLGAPPTISGLGITGSKTHIIYPVSEGGWTEEARKDVAWDANNMSIRNADGSLTKAPILCTYPTVEVEFGSAKSEWIRTDVFKNNRCFDFTVPKDMKTRIVMSYMLPCYHGSYFVTLLNSAGEELYSDIAMRAPGAGEMTYNDSYIIEPELKAGDYHLEVIYNQSHEGKSGLFTVGVYDAAPTDPTPDEPGTTDPKPDDTDKPDATDPEPVSTETMYRLYNPNSGEHFYTSSSVERQAVIDAGWNDEGVGWTAPTSGIKVYRLYNSFAGEHHYTTSEAERDMLVGVGWTWEEGGWYSDPNEAVPLYRAYNPNAYANNHHYTLDRGEFQTLLSLGWQDEGVGWYGVK